MHTAPYLKTTPWDTDVFGMSTYEVLSLSPESIEQALQTPGHHTLKVDPLASKKLLQEAGFYYCDTLIEPYCDQQQFIFIPHKHVSITNEVNTAHLLETCQDAFLHGRFHRDFNVPNAIAEKRYSNWLLQLHAANKVYELHYEGKPAGFIAVENNKLVLHAINQAHRGKGLAKFFWSLLCETLFVAGASEITSSISAANLAVLNLYVSLGFRFRHAVDIYHRLVL